MSRTIIAGGQNGTYSLNKPSSVKHSYFPSDLGGARIGCRASSVIEQIWIDEGNRQIITYGGTGGVEGQSVILPPNGIIHLKEVWYGGSSPEVISYLKFGVINGENSQETDIVFGDPSISDKKAYFSMEYLDVWVKFSSIWYNTLVDGLEFEIVD